MTPEDKIKNALEELRSERESDLQIIRQQRELIAELQGKPPMDEHTAKIMGILGEVKKLVGAQRGVLIGWLERLLDEHDKWEKEGED